MLPKEPLGGFVGIGTDFIPEDPMLPNEPPGGFVGIGTGAVPNCLEEIFPIGITTSDQYR